MLGALDADERERVEAHLAGCAECSVELGELAPLPGLLQRVPEADVIRATDPVTGLHAQVTLTSSPRGTDLALKLTGVTAGEECSLVASAGDQRDVTACWDATYTGEATFIGSTYFAVDQIDMLVIETPAGRALLTMPVD